MLKSLLTLALAGSFFLSYAQKNTSQSGNYKIRTIASGYLTQFQKGYVILRDGTRINGEIALSGDSYDAVYRVKIKTATENHNLSYRALTEYGLDDNLVNDTPGAFKWRTLDKIKLNGDPNAPPTPSNTRKASSRGYVITKKGKVYQGDLKLKEFKKKVTQISVKTDKKEKYKFEAEELSNFGAGKYDPAVAEEEPEEMPEEEEEMGEVPAVAGASKISLDSVVALGPQPGYLITEDGQKITGTIAFIVPKKGWFARGINITTADGEKKDYLQSPLIRKVIITVQGEQKEFINFENEYVEVLHRVGPYVHFRNPHPTTTSTGGDIANMFAGAALESADQSLKNKQNEKALKDGDINIYQAASRAESIKNNSSAGDIDYTELDIVTIYAKEYMVMNETVGNAAMYLPGRQYYQLEGELMGSYDYLMMEKEEQKRLKKMQDPMATLTFLNDKIAEAGE